MLLPLVWVWRPWTVFLLLKKEKPQLNREHCMGVLCLPRQVRNELEGFVILEESFDIRVLELGWKGGGCVWKNSNVEYRKSMNHCVCHQPNSCSLKHRLWHINQSWQHFDGGSKNKGSKWAWFYKNFQNLQYS